MNMKKYYGQLVGAKIVGFNLENDDWSSKPWPVFTLELGKQKVKMTISKDAEGNGGGFAFIEEA